MRRLWQQVTSIAVDTLEIEIDRTHSWIARCRIEPATRVATRRWQAAKRMLEVPRATSSVELADVVQLVMDAIDSHDEESEGDTDQRAVEAETPQRQQQEPSGTTVTASVIDHMRDADRYMRNLRDWTSDLNVACRSGVYAWLCSAVWVAAARPGRSPKK